MCYVIYVMWFDNWRHRIAEEKLTLIYPTNPNYDLPTNTTSYCTQLEVRIGRDVLVLPCIQHKLFFDFANIKMVGNSLKGLLSTY